jgi:TonB family protein
MRFRRAHASIGVTVAIATAVLTATRHKPAELHPPAFRVASTAVHPDEPPAVLNTELPFHYPAALYARKVQGNVTLRLYLNRNGRVVPDSTRVEEASGFPLLDSAAIAGSRDLRFVPAKLRGEPVPVTILFPVWFRHPQARPLPGDSAVLGPRS